MGDGINDAIALIMPFGCQKANVSISLRGASSAATDSASMILMDGTLNQLISLLDLAQTRPLFGHWKPKRGERNLSPLVILTIIPCVTCIGGVFLFNLGILGAIVLYNLGLVVSILNALRPLIKHQFDTSSQSNK